MRLQLVVAYVGTHYNGWQLQDWKSRQQPPTFQGALEQAFFKLCGQMVRVHGAGRTDTGVHARGQIAHCDVPDRDINWRLGLNRNLPFDIRILDARQVSEDFHARFQAKRKEYAYRLWLNRHFTPPHLMPQVWACGPVDLEKVQAAVPELLGQRDFKSLQNKGTDIEGTVRTLHSITFSPDMFFLNQAQHMRYENGPLEGFCPIKQSWLPVECLPQEHWLLCVRFQADGFLKQMVRNLMGLLVACGRGKLQVQDIAGILESQNRRTAPATAPAQGLSLERVWYDEPLPEDILK